MKFLRWGHKHEWGRWQKHPLYNTCEDIRECKTCGRRQKRWVRAF